MSMAQGKPPIASKAASWKAPRPLVILAWFGLGMAVQLPSHAAPAASSPGSYSFELNYLETDEVLASRQFDFKVQKTPFQKEPPLGKKDVFRGLLLCGERPDQAAAFIWDKPNSQLYLDLNRNRDLTDDPQGVFVSTTNQNSQTFTNIQWTFPAATSNRTVLLELHLYTYGAGNLRVYAGLPYLWQAKVSLHGAEWQLGLVEGELKRKASTPPEYLLLRPWAERQRPFHLSGATPDFCGFTTNLFFGGHAYALDWRYEPGGAAGKYAVTFREQAPRLGEVKVTGANLHRLILTGSRGMTLLLDQPQGTLAAPVGTYSLDEVWLRQGDVEVIGSRAGKITVEAQRPLTLVAGGPLTNSVSAGSEQNSLRINYRLLGAGGLTYQLARPDYKHPPEFAIFQGTNRLAAGKFEFG
jgi:hypothetical protein